jgi:hypothetical protein
MYFVAEYRGSEDPLIECNALIVCKALTPSLLIDNIYNSFLFLSFCITSLHSSAGGLANFTRIRGCGRHKPWSWPDLPKNMCKFGEKATESVLTQR